MLPNSNYDLNNNSNSDSNMNSSMNLGNSVTNVNNNIIENNSNVYPPKESINNNLVNNENIYVHNQKMKTDEEIKNEVGQTMALMAYLGPLVFIPYIKEKENSFVLYHVKQGLNLFILEAIIIPILEIIKALFLSKIFFLVSIVDFVSGIFFIGLSVIGIYYVLEGKMKELPLIGNIRIVK